MKKAFSKGFKSVEEVREERERVDSEFDGGLPDYLVDYFDEQEKKLLNKEYYDEVYSIPWQERKEYGKQTTEKFWEENEFELKKVSHRGIQAGFPEAPRATERFEEELDLGPEGAKILIKICEDDLYLFAIRYFKHYLKKPSSELHKWLYQTLTRELGGKKKKYQGMKLAVAAPRGNAKSSIVSNILPIWCICYKKKNFIIMVSDTKGQAEDFLGDIKRELELNELLRRDFPHVAGAVHERDLKKGLVWRADEIITKNMVRVLALGTGSKIRGRKFGVNRPDLVIGDDLENAEMVRSETQRDQIRGTWFNKDFVFAGAGDSGDDDDMTDFFIVGTILGKDSLLNALMDPREYPDWRRRKFQAVKKFSDSPLWEEWEKLYKNRFDMDRIETARKFFEERQEEMLEGTEVLWPEGDTYYSLMIDRLKSLSAFLTEKQNEGVDLSKVYVTRDLLHWEDFRGNKEIAIAINRGLKRGYVYGAIDPSLGKKSKSGDFSAIITVVRDPVTGFIFVIHMDIKRRSVEDQVKAILKNHIRFGYKLFAVETNAFQYVLAEAVRKASREQGFYVPLEEINNYQDKKMRVEGVVPFMKDGTIVFDKTLDKQSQSYNRGIEQICTFTGENDSEDDAPDCLEMAVRIAKAPKFRMITS
ncbi:MAG: phage terminase large subunit [Promethearchaeota archaeon]